MELVPKRVSKYPVVRSKWPRIIDYRQSKLCCFMVDGRRRGNGKREYFHGLTEARTRADQLAIKRENHGIAALNFSAADSAMTAECGELLAPIGKTIRDATEHLVAFLKAEAIKSQSPLVRECTAQFIASRQRDFDHHELAKRSLDELK